MHSGSGNKNAFKALIAAEYCGVKVELPKNFEMGVSNKTPEFIKMNPLGKVHELDSQVSSIYSESASKELIIICRFLFLRLLMVLFLRAMLLHAMVYIVTSFESSLMIPHCLN